MSLISRRTLLQTLLWQARPSGAEAGHVTVHREPSELVPVAVTSD